MDNTAVEEKNPSNVEHSIVQTRKESTEMGWEYCVKERYTVIIFFFFRFSKILLYAYHRKIFRKHFFKKELIEIRASWTLCFSKKHNCIRVNKILDITVH